MNLDLLAKAEPKKNRELREPVIEQFSREDWVAGVYHPTPSFRTIMQHSCVCRPNKELISVSGPAEDRESQIQSDLFAAAPDLYLALKNMVHGFGDPAHLRAGTEALAKAMGVKNG